MTFYLTACDRHQVNMACPLPPFVSVLSRFHCITSSIHYLLFLSDSTPENFTNIWQNEGVLCHYPEAPATEKKRREKVTLSVIFFFICCGHCRKRWYPAIYILRTTWTVVHHIFSSIIFRFQRAKSFVHINIPVISPSVFDRCLWCRYIWTMGIKFRCSSVLNFILFFKKAER